MRERGMDVGMRIALRQQAAERAQQRDAIERVRQAQEGRRRQLKPFHREIAEVLIEPRAPGGAHAIAGLQDRTQPGAGPAPHQTEVTPVPMRHQLEDGARLPVPAHAQHDSFIGPLHRVCSTPYYSTGILLLRELQPHLAVALRVVAPAFADLHKQKQVHRLLDHLGDLAASLGADRLDGLAALAEHDLTLTLSFDEDRLLDAYGTVLALLPARGLDGRLVWQ